MAHLLDNNKPIYLQIREKIEDQIIKDLLKEGDQVPSTNQLVNFYKVNHITVSKGINQLVDEGILYKKRGVGMFVAEGAKQKLIEHRKKEFIENVLVQLVDEADILGINDEELVELLKSVRRRKERE